MHVGMCSAPVLRVCMMLVMRAWCCWHHWNVHSQCLEPSKLAVRLLFTCHVHVATGHELDLVYPGLAYGVIWFTSVRYAHNLYVCMVGVFPIFPEGEPEFVYIREALAECLDVFKCFVWCTNCV